MLLGFFCLLIGLTESRFSEQLIKCNLGNSTVFQQLVDTVDVWGTKDGKIDIRVKNIQEKEFVESLLDECQTVLHDLEEYVRIAEVNNTAARAACDDWFSCYHTYEELDSWYQNLADANPNFITYGPIPEVSPTYEGNTIKVLSISVARSPLIPSVYFQAQIHAREWISAATLNYLIDSLVRDYKNGEPSVVNLLRNVNVYAVPVLNIDGYKWTWTGANNRLWRKNRNPSITQPTCIGVDVNRNYNDHWGQGGSSTNPCSDTYMGTAAASEAETIATQQLFHSVRPVIVGIDWHSYGQLVLRPYGWTLNDSPDEAVLQAQGNAYAQNILLTTGKVYTSQKSIQLYVTTGTASDWFYGAGSTTNNNYRAAGYTVELRPVNNPPGFLLPDVEIIPCGQENYKALIPFLAYFAANPILG